ncbi:MAG: hypothetical protein JWN86_2519 [Planctomycetota bacterium]|nr:hypothetical protein [Planctomycetota bacterium]
MLRSLMRRAAAFLRPVQDSASDSQLIPPPGFEWLADQYRDEIFDRLFASWRRMSPEEYAAHNAHTIGAYSLHYNRYRNPEMGRWARRLGLILESVDETDRCRREHLSATEYAEVHRAIELIRLHPELF